MNRTRIAAALAALGLSIAFAATAETTVYRWVDRDGKVHFSDTPPPEDAKSASQRRLGGGYVEESALPYATQMAVKRNPVTLFIATDCGTPCDSARELLSRRGVPYTERNAQSAPAEAEALRKAAGTAEVPFLTVGDNKLRGFEEEAWNSALDAAGYPRTRLPGQPAPVTRQAAGSGDTPPAAPPR
jgi:glutaredoxin